MPRCSSANRGCNGTSSSASSANGSTMTVSVHPLDSEKNWTLPHRDCGWIFQTREKGERICFPLIAQLVCSVFEQRVETRRCLRRPLNQSVLFHKPDFAHFAQFQGALPCPALMLSPGTKPHTTQPSYEKITTTKFINFHELSPGLLLRRLLSFGCRHLG